MKKICFVTTIYLTYKMFLKEFSTYLYNTGEYDISLICNDEKEPRSDLPPFVHYYPVKMKRGVSLSAFFAIKQIEEILKEQQFDIVQYSTPNAAFYASIAAKKAKVPVRLYCQWGIRYMGFDGWKRALFKYIEKKTCENSTFVEVESHNIRDFSLQEELYTREKSCVIWNGSASGVDLSKFDVRRRVAWREEIRHQWNIGAEDIVYAFAGRLTADKGVNELLEAFIHIAQDYSSAKLMIMGGMDNSASLNAELMESAQKSNQIIFVGSVDDIERYYAAADVFVAPSYREGFGLVVVEAEAMGLPAIVSDVPGQIDAIVPDVTGLACKVKDASALEESMRRLLYEPDFRKQLGKSAAEFAKNNFEQKELFSYLRKHRDELID